MKVNAAERLIVALDMPEIAAARDLMHRLRGTVSVYKLGPWLLLAPGFEALLDDMAAAGLSVFMDTKHSDIPETMRAAAAAAARRNLRFLTVHGNDEVSDEALAAAVEGRGPARPGGLALLAVTVLTSLSSDAGTVLRRAERALRLGLDGVIASGNEAAAIRAMAGGRPFLVVTPGIRPAGAEAEDHKRPATPTSAIAAGADYLVAGRPIVRASDPAAAAMAMAAEMQRAFDLRDTAPLLQK